MAVSAAAFSFFLVEIIEQYHDQENTFYSTETHSVITDGSVDGGFFLVDIIEQYHDQLPSGAGRCPVLPWRRLLL